MSQKLEVIRGVYESLAKGDVPSILAVLASDIEWKEADGFPYAGTYLGREAVLEGVFMRLGTEWDSFSASPDEFLDAGDAVVVLGKYAGTYKGTGKSFVADFAHVWRVKDQTVVRFAQYVDSHLVQLALK